MGKYQKVEGIKPFQWRAPIDLFNEVRKIAGTAGTSMNYEVSRLIRSGIDRDKKEEK